MVLIVTTTTILPAQSDEQWSALFLDAAEDIFKPTEPLQVFLPESMPAEILEWLALELDEVDVSEIVSLEQVTGGQIVTVTPPEPLKTGDHVLRLLEFTQAGDVIEHAIWEFQVSAGEAQVTAAAQINTAAQRFFSSTIILEGTYRIAEENIDRSLSKGNSQGSASLHGIVQGETWLTESSASFLYDSSGAQVGALNADQANGVIRDGRDFELAEYLVSARSPNISALVGHHQPVSNSLLIQDFHRRGASLTTQTNNQSVVASGFAYRTEPVSGFRFGAGIGDRKHRVAGGIVSLSPVSGNKELLTITSTYIDGAGEDHSGIGITGSDIKPAGIGRSIAIESQMINNRLQLNAERAETDYDFDGEKDDFQSENGQADSFQGLFHVWQNKQIGERQASWNVGFEQKKIDLFFRSLANPSLPFDRKLQRISSVFQSGGYAMQLQLAREEDNVEQDKTLPTLRNDLASLLLSYTPTPKTDDQGQPVSRWYGQPSYSVSTQYSSQEQVHVPIELIDFKVDRLTSFYQGGASFQHDTWYWGLNHTYGLEKSFGQFAQQNRHRLTDLSLQFLLGDRLTFSTQGQYNSIQDRDTFNSSRSWLAALDTRISFFDQRLITSFNYSLNQDGAKDDSVNSETETLGLRLDWILRTAQNNRPGWTVWLQGERQSIDDRLAPQNDLQIHQAFLGARMDWPVAYPNSN